MHDLPTIFLIVALVCFVLSAFEVTLNRINLVSLGLAFWVLSILVPILT